MSALRLVRCSEGGADETLYIDLGRLVLAAEGAQGIAVVLEDMWASMVAPKYATSGANGNAVFTDVWSRWYNVSASAIAPVGYYWRALNFYVTDSNVTTDPLQLVAE